MYSDSDYQQEIVLRALIKETLASESAARTSVDGQVREVKKLGSAGTPFASPIERRSPPDPRLQ
jgi:hypothetical protein